MSDTGFPSGWRFFWLSGAVVLAIGVGVPAAHGFETDALRWGIRFTARSSAVLFLLAFVASAMVRLFPSAPSRWLRANRRHLGLAFAFSHGVHAGQIIAYASQGPQQYAAAVTPDMIIAGSIGYALIILMAATSFQRPAAMIGRSAWSILHMAGISWLWLQFVIAFGKRAAMGGPIYWFFLGLFAAALALRIVAWRRSAGQTSLPT
jgi:DMSO/TMAO reductase YedYZ heme-binding membrane subunit